MFYNCDDCDYLASQAYKMPTINKPVIMAKPVSLPGSIKQTTITPPAAKKPLKPDSIRKTSIAAPKTTTLSKPVVSKMASTKVLAAIVDKSAISSKLSPFKSIITSPSNSVLAKTSAKSCSVEAKVNDETISINIEDHFTADSDPASVNVNLECNSDDFVVVEMVKVNGEEDMEQVPLIVDDCSAMEAEKSADTESVASVDSTVSYADVVKQSAIEGTGDFESIEKEPLVKLEVEEDIASQQMVLTTDNLLAEIVANEEDVTVTGAAAEDAEAAAENGDAAAADTEATEATEDAEACTAPDDVEKSSVEEQTVKVEPLLGLMTDVVQQELGAGMKHSHAEDEEGYVKVQKKRNKKHNKRNQKSLKALQKENIDVEPVTEVQESQDDLQILQKRRNFRRAKNSMKRQHRRYSEPYSNSHCYSTPVWRSYYVEH